MSGRSQMTTMNGKRPSSIPPRHQTESTSQHLDLIKYLYDSWNSVSRELDTCNSSNYRNGASVTYYQEREPNPQLKASLPRWSNSNTASVLLLYIFGGLGTATGLRALIGRTVVINRGRNYSPTLLRISDFQPFNLETWWGQRVVQSITRNASS